MNNNRFLVAAFVLGALGVALGAFGTHTLRSLVDEKVLQAYNTGVQYHFYHTLALLFVALYQLQKPSKWVSRAGWFFITGIGLFAGSLYGMTFCKAAGLEGVSWLGAITPFGGVCFIAGWICLLVAATSKTNHE
jgi:uncharacterized membrane protein YgdD (TMEM256/DUF423 family)